MRAGRLRNLTSVGRPLDAAWATNRAIAGLTAIVCVLGAALFMWSGREPVAALIGGVVLAIAFFLAWALARELDPDHHLSAFAAAALSLSSIGLPGRPELAATVLVLLVLRVVNRTVGPAARPLDTLTLLALAGFAAWRGHVALAGAAAVGLIADAILAPAHRLHLAAAGAAAAMSGAGWWRLAGGEAGVSAPEHGPVVWIALALLAPFLLLVRASGCPRTVPDRGGPPLSGRRVRAAQVLALAAFAGTALLEGRSGVVDLFPLWAALAGTGLYFSIGAPTRLPHSVHEPS